MTNDEVLDNPLKKSDFICGVVEGFYGRPWTTEQRKDLFQKLKKWGMDCYLYAPKDDYKHRAYWRELYTVEEAEHLSGLIASAKESGITFYYALSPGLDITYSSSKEVSTLKRKLEQVAQFGCNAFALLFDDIEPEMTEADKEVFQSFAQAQVCITNEVFQQLNQPQFIVCPTQYCSARANPDVKNSEYLNTLGSKLAPEIDIMWTGHKVISRLLTVECIEEITEVLKRPPVIWDNIHANDYDQKRIFLGPYQGRSPDVIKKLRGVLTNPNCEYGANFVAIHTLAQWSKCSTDATMHLNLNDSVSADIKLETESEDGVTEDMPCSLPDNVYHPRRSLKNAIYDWLSEFKRPKPAWGPISKPQPSVPIPIPVPIILPSINTCMTLTTPTTSITSVITAPSTVSSNQLQELTCSTITCTNSSILQPTSNGVPVVMNSLASENKVISEPMEVNMTPTDSPTHLKSSNLGDVPMIENSNIVSSTIIGDDAIPGPENTMIVDMAHSDSSDSSSIYSSEENELQYEDLALLCDLFYLPFEHGSQGVQIMHEFNWLKSNAHIVSLTNLRRHNTRTSPAGEDTPEVQEWRERAKKLMEVEDSVNRLFRRLTYCNNRELVHELYPYVWDMRGVVSLLNSYIKWLGNGNFPHMISSFTLGNYTWFSKGWKENFMSGDQEPWVFRGGLIADLQRLIPVDAGADLFTYKPPEIPINKIYTVRPYTAEDEVAVYDICRRTCLDGEDGTEVFRDYPDFAAERVVGGFLTICPELCFVVEDQTGIVGYAAAALNSKQFYSKVEVCWVPELREKYLEDSIACDSSTLEEMKNWFHSFKEEILPENAQFQHTSVMCASVLPTIIDQSTVKRLIVCLLAALRANGSFGVYVPINVKDKNFIDFYCKLGFVELCQGVSSTFVYLGRIF